MFLSNIFTEIKNLLCLKKHFINFR